MDDLLNEFLTESSENLAVLDAEIVRLERNPDDKESIGSIFRLVHTIKGTCGFLGLARLEAVAHAGENVLGKFRDGKLAVTPAAVTVILQCIDAIRAILSQLEETAAEPAGDDTWLIERLNALADGKQVEAAGEPAAPTGDSDPGEPAAMTDADAQSATPSAAAAAPPFDGSGGYPVAMELLAEVNAAKASGIVAATDDAIQQEMAAERVNDGAAGTAAEPADSSPQKAASPAESASGAPKIDAEIKESSVAKQSIRVAVDTLESLMTTVSELVLTRNQLLQMVRQRDDDEFTAPLQRLSHITSELQEGVMKTRMQPIGNAWAKLPRIVRDLAIDTGKKLDLIMKGADTELDRQVLELIKDPLTHMVRNSADHGIEPPAERRAAGKSETGAITLNAYHEGGHIIIEIKDDGRGLDKEKICRKAVALGLATEAELAAMSDQQIYLFVFKPAFSTAAKVTNVSGRGVGMDVVRTNIERIGGTIELASAPSIGSTFTIKIPLTLAIVSALIVACGGQRFAIPQICVDELVWVAETSEVRIETINGTPLLRLRDRLLPLIELKSLFGISTPANANADHAIEAASKKGGCFVIVTRVGQSHFGIIVDGVFDTEEIVVKPVAPILQGIRYYAGNTILGDGGVVMILDPNGIAGEIGPRTGQVIERITETQATHETLKRLLVFRAGGDDYKAIPLELLARLERFDLGKVEVSQGRHMIQYRGHLMPLVPCGEMDAWDGGTASRPTLVFTDRNHSMGLVVDEIVDIVEDNLNIEVTSEREGFVGSAIIEGRATDIIDVGYYLTMAFPDWFSSTTSFCEVSRKTERSLLLIDDSVFFRNLITPILTAAGFRVATAESASHALALRENGHHFDAIVSDIEMPGMNGFELAASIREAGAWRDTPLIALSSFASEADFQKGREAGFTDYVAKFDRDGLIHSLAQTFGCHTVPAAGGAATGTNTRAPRPGGLAGAAQGIPLA